MKKVIAIIPARSGSKRIPNKNIREICGKPMLAWTIEAAISSGIFSDILVSTDSPFFAEIAQKAGASAPFLRDAIDSDDFTPISIATVNALTQMEKETKTVYDTVVQLMPNCPCRNGADILDAYGAFVSNDSEFQLSVFKFGWMNPWWAMKIDPQSNCPLPMFPDALKKRSQDLEDLYCPTGAIWIAKVSALKRERTFYGTAHKVHPLRWQSAIDIDNEDDFSMAKAILSEQINALLN